MTDVSIDDDDDPAITTEIRVSLARGESFLASAYCRGEIIKRTEKIDRLTKFIATANRSDDRLARARNAIVQIETELQTWSEELLRTTPTGIKPN